MKIPEESKRKPDFANDLIAVWVRIAKNGVKYLSIKIFGEYFNVFPPRNDKKIHDQAITNI